MQVVNILKILWKDHENPDRDLLPVVSSIFPEYQFEALYSEL
jgi:hypothetical protein